MSEQKPSSPQYVIAALQCGCAVMQRQEANTRLFYLLQHFSEREITLSCPKHKMQQVVKLITRTHRRGHWPLVEHIRCSSCNNEMVAPPPPAENDELTMPNDPYAKQGVYIQCSSCHQWCNHSFVGTAEDRYDVLHRRVTCPSCHQQTLIAYDPSLLSPGEQIDFQCIQCRRSFTLVFEPKQQRGKNQEHS